MTQEQFDNVRVGDKVWVVTYMKKKKCIRRWTVIDNKHSSIKCIFRSNLDKFSDLSRKCVMSYSIDECFLTKREAIVAYSGKFKDVYNNEHWILEDVYRQKYPELFL